jgi:hypothetical protein
MAHPTTPKWLDFLLERRGRDGTWAKTAYEKPLDAMNALNSASTDTRKLDVAATGGDAAMMVAMNNGEVKFVHDIALAKAGGEFTLVGAIGLGHVATFVILSEESVMGTFTPASRRVGPAPSIDEFFQTTSDAAFKALKAGSTNSEHAGYAGRYKGGTFWCYPALWTRMPNHTMHAQDVAMAIIQQYPYDTEIVEGMEVSTVTAEQQKLEGVLQWLWMVSNESIKSHTVELTDDKEAERTCLHIQNKRRGTAPTGTTGAALTTTTGATEAIFRDAMSSMTRIQEKLLDSQLQDRERKKMTHRLTDEGRRLFQMLSASDWADYYDPTVPHFTEKLLADKDVGKALQYVQGEVERGRWSCTLSNNCLVQFFAQGYVGWDYQTTPSGLTVFMCRPLSVPKPSSQKEKEFIIRSTFGKTDLGDEGVKLFAKSDLHVPKSFDELAKQLDCMVKFLQLLNGTHNIGVQGYQTALRILHGNEQELAQLATRRPSVWSQLAFAFDTAFQRFLRQFTQIISTTGEEESPIEKGRHTLQTFMKDDIATLFIKVPYGHLPDHDETQNRERDTWRLRWRCPKTIPHFIPEVVYWKPLAHIRVATTQGCKFRGGFWLQWWEAATILFPLAEVASPQDGWGLLFLSPLPNNREMPSPLQAGTLS